MSDEVVMQAEMPFYETPEDALRAAIQALGGHKQVGALIWPDKTPDHAGRLLADCVNISRSEKLELTQVLRIFILAREKGCHEPFFWFAGEAGYEAKPVTVNESIDRLTAVIAGASQTVERAAAALERLQRLRGLAA